MALAEVLPTISYDGNESTVTPYQIPFPVPEANHLKLYLNGIASADPFIFEGAGSDNGGTVRTTKAYPSTTRVTWLRETPYEQPTDLEDGGRIPAETLEDAYDYLCIEIQQLWEKLQRAFLAPPGYRLTGVGFVSYLTRQAITLAQRAIGARNIHAWHFAGNLNGDDPAFLANAAACGPFVVGQIWAVEIGPKQASDFQPGPDGQFGTPDDVFVPGDSATVIIDSEGTEVQLRSTQFYVVMANSLVWTWRNMLQLPASFVEVDSLSPEPHRYSCTWDVNPTKCVCPPSGGGGIPGRP